MIFEEEIFGSAVTGLFYQQKNVPTGYILKNVCLLKQVPLFVPISYLITTGTYLVYGNMCPLPRASSSSYCTVYGR